MRAWTKLGVLVLVSTGTLFSSGCSSFFYDYLASLLASLTAGTIAAAIGTATGIIGT